MRSFYQVPGCLDTQPALRHAIGFEDFSGIVAGDASLPVLGWNGREPTLIQAADVLPMTPAKKYHQAGFPGGISGEIESKRFQNMRVCSFFLSYPK